MQLLNQDEKGYVLPKEDLDERLLFFWDAWAEGEASSLTILDEQMV